MNIEPVITLPDSFYERSGPWSGDDGLHGLPSVAAVARVAHDRTDPNDPAQAWFDAATVVGVIDTLTNLLSR